MHVFVIMGPSGCGKTTIGNKLAEKCSIPFFDADDFHSQRNIEKMSRGEALDDLDRKPWLEALTHLIQEHKNQNESLVLACSALKNSYQSSLSDPAGKNTNFIYLDLGKNELKQRLETRLEQGSHFMPETLLNSQLSALEIPADAVSIPAEQSPEAILDEIIRALPVLSSLQS